MADDNVVQIRFGAVTDDALDGIAQIRDALTGLNAPVQNLQGVLGRLNAAFGAAVPADMLSEAVEAFEGLGNQAARTVLQVKDIGAEIKLLQQGLAEQRTVLDAEASQFQITQSQKYAMLEAETQREYEAELALLNQEAALGNISVKQWNEVLLKIAELKEKHNADMLRLDEQAIAQQQQMWNSALGSIESAFNSQLRGLLAGTTTWSQAFKKILGDLIIQFIEMCETMVVKWAAAQLAQTTAATTGAAARAAAEQGASSAGMLSTIANAVKAIMTDAGQAFAGVFAFLAPTMGPAAAGPAAAAQASVSAAAIFDVGTDYVVRGGLALIHPGETIIPAARGSGPFSGAGMGAQVHAPVSINVSALDSQSVARFFNDNSRHMMRAINDAVKRGAHLGLRGASGR
jgi:hypothetical protein